MTPQPVAVAPEGHVSLMAADGARHTAGRVAFSDRSGRNLTRVQHVRFTVATTRRTTTGARGRGRSMDTREAQTMTAATALMCRMPACPATHGQPSQH